MRKITFLSILFLSAFTLKSQTEQGKFLLGFNNFSSTGLLGEGGGLIAPTNGLGIAFGQTKTKVNGTTRDEKPKYTTIGFSLDGHYFLIDNLAAGVGVNFFNQTIKEGNEKATLTLLMAGPRLRYFFPLSDNVKAFIRGTASFGSAKTKFEGEDEDKSNLTEFGGGLGVSIFPNPNFSINLGLGYSVFTNKDESTFLGTTTKIEDTYSGVVFDVGFGIFF